MEDAKKKSDNEQAPSKDAGEVTQSGNGLTSGLQPGGTIPNDKPGASVGSIGTGGGSTANKPTGNARQ